MTEAPGTEKVWDELYARAKAVLRLRRVSDMIEAGGVTTLGTLAPEWWAQ